MANKVTNYLREQIYGVWPRLGRLARTTVYFAAVDLFLLVLWQVGALYGRLTSLGGWVKFLTFITALLALLLGARWVRRRLMWRLRNRLVVTYVFIGVIPVVLLAMIGVLSAYLFAWQFATFIASSDIHAEVAKLSALNRRTALDLADRIQSGQAVSPELLRKAAGHDPLYADRHITAWYRGKPVVLPGAETVTMPPGGAPESRGVVLDRGRLLLRAADTAQAGTEPVTVIASVPLDTALLEKIGSGMGEISLSVLNQGAPEQRDGKPRVTVGNESLEVGAPGTPESPSVHAGSLPSPANRFDRVVTGGTFVAVVDWRTGKTRNALLGVLTRPSLLYARLFRTVGQSSSFLIAVLGVVAVVFAVIELLALFIGVRLTRTMTRSVADLYVATQHVDKGDLHYRIHVRRDDQMAELERSFNSMTASLEKLLAEQKEKQRLENELAIAQEVQAQLFPKRTRELPGLELYGICRPARTVSGDYYDFLPLDAEKVAVAAGDVSGKGISAALLMATIHSAVRAYSLQASVTPAMAVNAGGGYTGASLAYEDGDLSPARLMSLLNQQLYRSTPAEKYATLFFSSFDLRNRTLSYCNAGHLPPILLGSDGSIRRLDQGGTVVGLFDAVPFEEARVQLARGDMLIAYSDGITEPENDFGEFGEARLVDLIRENRLLPLERISEAVMSAVLDWIGGNEQPDDITLVLARPQ
jgi:sigma-B regulation protein RsbU (phosphoserine phosphatase)